MFDKTYEQQLALWREFRLGLETAEDPIQLAIDLFDRAPQVSFAADPYTPSTWPDPWEMIKENNYCDFVKMLAICYTLQLTDRFSLSHFEIHITHDKQRSSAEYLLFIDDRVVGLAGDTHVHRSQVPSTAVSEYRYLMPPLQ
jgi:hypothetical protein